MEPTLKTFKRIFKYISVLFTVGFFTYGLIDDWNLIIKYGKTNWMEYLGIWFTFFLIYFMMIAMVYWCISFVIIYIHQYTKPE